MLTVGPLGIAMLFLVDGHVERWIASVEARAGLIHVMGVVWSVSIITLMLLGTFVLLPNTQVSLRSAVGGAFVSAVLLQIGRAGLTAYINNAFSFSHLYGPLGFVPVLIIWTYAMWICINGSACRGELAAMIGNHARGRPRLRTAAMPGPS